ncbi:DNA cytosine methyltransferase [Streptomyces sp. NBC_01218]|uniref:DNA cytosine methyltransferase n=1 Tax=unclassified Streptomyces TaxID=2593676 RepID=UPI0023B88D04|nr:MULTISPECIES: DNA cytosine methyltransferase [unclassified Streptomyces]WEH42068.1 DNA cytosine methyltransferase [Streptomyces sp. AM 2-1-1]WSQ53690.1 DNA cytosine methyltransferase [Streptomyces sp. NBC_01218]
MVEQRKDVTRSRTSVELFAGGGGLAMAVHQAGFRPLLFNEFNPRACETLEASATRTLGVDGVVRTEDRKPSAPAPGEPTPLYAGDVRDLDLSALRGQVDVLAGGPPCQPFSAGGVAKGDEDKRNMFPAMFKAVREMQPKAIICENVRGLLRPSFREYFQYIQRELQLPFVERDDSDEWQIHNAQLERLLKQRPENDGDDQRYRVVQVSVNAANYGVPQIRHRVVLIGFRADLGVDVDAFEKYVNTPQYSAAALFRSLKDDDSEYWRRHSYVPDVVRERVQANLPPVIEEDDCAPWRTLRDAIQGHGTGETLPALPPVDLTKLDRKTEQASHLGIADHIGWPDARIYKGHTPNELDRPAKTVKAGVHGVPGGESVMLLDEREPDSGATGGWRYKHRYMTVRETARVMTFPDEWHGAGPRGEKMRQLGNAVPVTLGEFFAKAVADGLQSAGH